ncbi:MAG: hypothetical protein GC164_03565 [Phycisphaera sp.]|nr:hypothetical protein [Phycisphaera sp.]
MKRPTQDRQMDQAVDLVAESEEIELREEVHKVVEDFVPWTLAVLVHLALVIFACFVIWAIPSTPDEPPVVPLVTTGPTPSVPLTTTVTRQPKLDRSSVRSVNQSTTQAQQQLMTNPTQNERLVGLANINVGTPSPFTNLQTGTNNIPGFFSDPPVGNVHKLVYLIDASGSIIDTMPFVIAELQRSISQLNDDQQFSVIFFRDGEAVQLPPPGLRYATQENKDFATRWVALSSGHVEAHGRSSPLTAIRTALGYKPQMMYLLSDNITGTGTGGSRYEIRQRDLLAEIQKANTGGTKINTIQFLYPDPLAAQGMTPTLKAIADMTGGTPTFLNARALNLE